MASLEPQGRREVGAIVADGTRRLAGLNVSRRRLFGWAGGAVVAGAAAWAGPVLGPDQVAYADGAPPDLYLAGTDGWIHLPPDPPIAPFHPDTLAPDGLTTYIFGFRNVTGMTDDAAAQPEEQGPALGAAVLGRTSTTATPPTSSGSS